MENSAAGPVHYIEAHRVLNDLYDLEVPLSLDQRIAMAQVHATLALAAATALCPYERDADPNQESGDWTAWLAVADTKE